MLPAQLHSIYLFFFIYTFSLTGVILCFRELIQDALTEQLEERIPFLTSSIKDFHSHGSSPHETSLVAELACAAGYSSRVDPALLTTLRQTPKVIFTCLAFSLEDWKVIDLITEH